MELKEIETERMQLVVKSNDLIRQSRFDLSVREQRIVLYLISKIRPEDSGEKLYEIKMRDFCEVCGIEYRENTTALKEIIQDLADKSIWVKLADGRETLLRWVERPYINYDSDLVQIKLDTMMVPYLVNLKGNFTQYELIATLAMKSKFSIRLFELFQSYKFEGRYDVSLSQLRRQLGIKSEYKAFYDFRRYVIDVALDEIHSYTNLLVTYEAIRDGRKINRLVFKIETNLANDGGYEMAEGCLDGELPSRYELDRRYREMIGGESVHE